MPYPLQQNQGIPAIGAVAGDTPPLSGQSSSFQNRNQPQGLGGALNANFATPAATAAGTPGLGVGSGQTALGQQALSFPGQAPQPTAAIDFAQGSRNILNQNDQLATSLLQRWQSGQLPPGYQAAIDAAYAGGSAALTNQLAAEGLDPATSSQYSGGVAQLQEQKAIITQRALDTLLSQAFQAEGIELNAAQLLEKYATDEQQILLGFAQLYEKQKAFGQSYSLDVKKTIAGSIGELGKLFGSLATGGASDFASLSGSTGFFGGGPPV